MRRYVLLFAQLALLIPHLAAQAPPPQTILLPIPSGWTCSSPSAPRKVQVAGMTVTFGQGYTRDETDNNGNVIGSSFLTDQTCPNADYRQLAISFSEQVKNMKFRFTWSGQQAQIDNGNGGDTAVNPSSVPFGQQNVFFPNPAFGVQAFVNAPTGSWLLMLDSFTFEKADTNDKVKFDLAPPSIEKVLISKTRSDDSYPSQNQIGEREILVSGIVVDQLGTPVAGRPISLRVIDPPDRAPYSTIGNQSHINDNADPLDNHGLNLNTRLSATSLSTDTNGRFSTILTVTSRYAGDNYVIEGSIDAAFPCASGGPNGSDSCAKSGTYEAWKRVYVEKHKELQNGMLFTAHSNQQATTIRVDDNHYNGNQPAHRRITRGDYIVLVHGPALDRTNAAAGQYLEYHHVADVQNVSGTNDYIVTLGVRQGKTVQFEPLVHEYGPDPTIGAPSETADSIALIAGTSVGPADYFDAPEHLVVGTPTVASVFQDAFTEYVIVPDGPSGFVPVPNFGTSNQTLLQTFADKWNSSVPASHQAPPNHQLLLIGDNDQSAAPDAGVTVTQVAGERSSWVWRGTIDDQVNTKGTSNFGQSADQWSAKTSAHELGHEWLTNLSWSPSDHCPSTTRAYNDPTLYCLLADADPAGSETQRANGIARFHMLLLTDGTYQSEYFEIRHHADPFQP